ncbi:CHAT domain-containing protein [Fulvivirga sp. M361]|uniref:CHAT domain-containing protein n=1 Tax=Fulvivirga sp. M361 TaxID=2594266 RepID=UPI00117AA6CD|nr:CHAT domain-containing tetratricopeptide repeat protein [Fulvivirga sp. M361]TRX56074.1 CHAT domain-containing protein [Fulvivirga sp. M361]
MTGKRILLLVLLLSMGTAEAQIGKFLKEKVKTGLPELQKNAKSFFSKKIEESRSKFDSTSFNYAISLNDNAGLFDHKEKGEQFVKVLTNIPNKDKPKTDAERARGNLDAGEVLYASGNYQLAENQFLYAKLAYEVNELKEDVNYIKVISNLGLLYSTTGRYTTSEEFIQQSLDLRAKQSGEESSGYGASLNNLAVLYKETGQYNKAEDKINHAIEVISKANGDNSMPYAIALNNQAMLFQTMGRYDQAEKMMNKTIGISGAQQSERSGNHQKFLTNRALLYQEMGQYEKSEAEFKELIRLKKGSLGRFHPDYAHVQSSLAALYMDMGKYGEVEPLLNDAIEIYQKKFGDEHPVYASAISDLGNFYRFEGKFDEAEPLLTKSNAIRKKTLGENHPAYVQSIEDLAILYWNKKDYTKAEKLYKESLTKSMEFISNFFPPMSEAEKTRYWDKLHPRFERFFSFAVDVRTDHPSLMSDVYDYHVVTKGLLLSSTSKVKEKILKSDDKELIKDYLSWLDQKEMLARYYAYSKEELEEQKIDLDSIERTANATERSLSQRSDLFSEGYELKKEGFKEVKARLKEGEAIVDLVRVPKFNNNPTGEIKYVALLVKPGKDKPEYVVIDNGVQLETRYYKYYNNIIQQKLKDEYSYKQYWLDIDAKLVGVKKLYISADGIYNQINLNTLLMPDGKYVLSNYETVLVSNSKNVKSGSGTSAGKSAVLIGNPPFSGPINPLPATKTELDNVSRLLSNGGIRSTKYLGEKATEANLKAIKSPKILHIATHGYFLKDEQVSSGKVFGISAESARNNPLLRSGLLLSGAEKTIDTNNPSLESNDNGILTAYEALNLDLENTELVVLSACETGTGDVKAGEGVYGLQRAFLAAGSDGLIMSLWKVDDKATQELMSSFYKYWIRYKNRTRAFRQAQNELKAKYGSPYYWGAFVMVEN